MKSMEEMFGKPEDDKDAPAVIDLGNGLKAINLSTLLGIKPDGIKPDDSEVESIISSLFETLFGPAPKQEPRGKTLADIVADMKQEVPITITTPDGGTTFIKPEAGISKAPAKEPKPKRHLEPIETDDNGVILKASGLSVIHFHEDESVKGKGMTVCYRDLRNTTSLVKNQKVVTISTSIVHPEDTFSKKKGTEIALKNFLKGDTVNLPLLPGLDIVDTLITYFWTHSGKYSTQFMSGIASGLLGTE